MGSQDGELIQRWQQGDAAAFEDIVRRWQVPLARFLFHLVGSAELVSDLCQEVFLRVYHAGPRYRDCGAFSSWLYHIALNVAREAGRRRRHEPVTEANQEVADNSAPAETVCAEQEAAQLVARAVSELPEPQRVVLILRHYEQRSFEEISRLTGTPASTLKSRFAAALTRLRDRLEELGLGPEESNP
jgi:RNA polymerase sigma-70 factor, ECF subfamily